MEKEYDITVPNNLNNRKGSFQFKKGENGIILTVHHTIVEGNSIIRIRFVAACFSEGNIHFVAIDHRGHVFVFDLPAKKFWRLSEKIPHTVVMRNSPHCISDYLIGTRDGRLYLINIETGKIKKSKSFSAHRIENISFFDSLNIPTVLLHTRHEAILINLNNFERTHQLNFNKNKLQLKFVSFIPRSEKIFTCFTNDSVHIWSGVTLNTIRILHPIKIRDRYIRMGNVQELNISSSSDIDFDEIFKGSIKDYTTGLINACSFSLDGCFICLTTIDDFVIILSSIAYEIIKLIKLKDVTCMKSCFLPQSVDLMIFVVTTTWDVLLIDCNDLQIKAIMQDGKSYKMNISSNGKLLFIILKTGEINMFKTSAMINSLKMTQNCLNAVREGKGIKHIEVGILDKELKKYLTRDRLIPILKEYCEYPEKYRHLIWCSLLDLPCNKNQYGNLSKKGPHPSISDYSKNYPLKDSSALRNLKKVMSCLIHWCTVFGHCDFIPGFVFPFLKIFPNNPILTFELVVSILLNHCQLWFEFAPMEPLNYLGIIENAFVELDTELSQFYKNKQITPKIYAWPLLSSAFSEVLDEQQWYQLWDNIISNQPYFLPFCVIAYNIVQKDVIINLQNEDSIKDFFHEQNIIDMKKLLKKVKILMQQCSESVHPKRYLKKYIPLPRGYYPKMENYPRKWVQLKDTEMETLRIEKEILDAKIRELEKSEMELAKRLEEGLKQEVHEKRMKEVEKLYEEALSREEERIACQRKMLLLYQKQIHDRKGKVLELVRESAFRRNVNLRENELDSLMRTIERGRNRDETDMLFADEEIKLRELNLLAQKYKTDSFLMDNEPFKKRFKDAIQKLEKEKEKLTHDLKILRDGGRHNKSTQMHDLTKKMSAVESMLQQIQIEFIRTIEANCEQSSKDERFKELEEKTKNLEGEIHRLLGEWH